MAVLDETGDVITGRRAHALLGFRAHCAEPETGEAVQVVTAQGWDLSWDDPAVADELSDALGRRVRLVRNPVGVHDVAPIHLLSLGSLAAARAWVDDEDIDRRRFRANIILDLERADPFVEDGWVGARDRDRRRGPGARGDLPRRALRDDHLRPGHPGARQPGARRAGPRPGRTCSACTPASGAPAGSRWAPRRGSS